MRPRAADVSPEDTPRVPQHGQNQKKTDKTLPGPLRQGVSRAQASSALLTKMPMRSHGHPRARRRQEPRSLVLFRLPVILGQKETKIQEVRHLSRTTDSHGREQCSTISALGRIRKSRRASDTYRAQGQPGLCEALSQK